ncbi:unnamed protein product [Rhizoctonia solani]|uniref:ubiquitinyl hydrolase 1 n=1 Tax=Rhizoctonia solani TaxID=456999 RepID=A0A8H2XAD3_9AGAM|nr:unnamed protein product [Rhizoctonia solani]
MDEEDNSSGWQLTESDPGVPSELLKTLGVPLVVDDLYSLDAESLAALQPIRALIFLFKWIGGGDETGGAEGRYDEEFPGFFAHQPKSSQDAYHFISYLPVMGQIYEFDGLKRAPVAHGSYAETGEGWVAKAREVIEKRIGTYPLGSLHFNLLAVRDDPLPKLQAQIEAAQAAGQELAAANLISRLSQEKEKRARWDFENSLRRHNHLGLIHALLVQLAKKDKLDAAVTGAKAKMQERLAKARESGQMEED